MRQISSYLPTLYTIDLSSENTVVINEQGGVHIQEPGALIYDTQQKIYTTIGEKAVALEDRLSGTHLFVPIVRAGLLTDDVALLSILSHWKLFPHKNPFLSFLPRSITFAISYRNGRIYQQALQKACSQLGYFHTQICTHGQAVSSFLAREKGEHVFEGIVYIGADFTDIYFLKQGELYQADTVAYGNEYLDMAITRMIFQSYHFCTSKREISSLKKFITMLPTFKSKVVVIHGQDVETKKYTSVKITNDVLIEQVLAIVEILANKIAVTIARLPVGLREDLQHYGITIAGVGADVIGLDVFLQERLQLPVRIAPRAKLAAALGAYQQ